MNLDYGAIGAAVVASLAMLAAALITRRTAKEANRVDAFEASLTGMQAVVDAYGERIGSLELELRTVKTALIDEQRAHGEARGLFQVATRHIRELHAWFATWLEGNRDDQPEPPDIPTELKKWV